jgi:hypothetical protein
MPWNRACTDELRLIRLDQSIRFRDAASLIRELVKEDGRIADAYLTLCVYAGIAAADVICCARLGEQSQGGDNPQDHEHAIGLLAGADPGSAEHLRTLLSLKTKAGYRSPPVTADDCRRAESAADALVKNARGLEVGPAVPPLSR